MLHTQCLLFPGNHSWCTHKNPCVCVSPLWNRHQNHDLSIWLVVLTIWKNMSMGRIIPYILENKRCLKPPASHLLKILNIWGFLKSWWIPSPHRARAWISWIRPPWRRSKLHIDMGMCQNHPYLVGGFNLPLWKIWVSWDDDIPNVWINNMNEPPTSYTR